MTRPIYKISDKISELLTKYTSLRSKNPAIDKILEDNKTQPSCGPREVYDQTHNENYSRKYA